MNQTVATGSYTGAGYARTTMQPTDQPTESPSGIRDAMQFSEDTLSSIHAALSHLESRLDVVLTPVAPTPSDVARAGNVPPPVRSNFHERLGIFNGVLSDALSRLNALRDRVEV